MAIQSSGLSLDLVNLSQRLLFEYEVSPRARIIVQAVAEALPGAAVNIYILKHAEGDEPVWSPLNSVGDAKPDHEVSATVGALGILANDPHPFVLSGDALSREEYAHLNVRRTIVSLACLPMYVEESLFGVLEIVTFDAPITASQLESLSDATQMAGTALGSAQTYEEERHGALKSISRLTQFYDIEKVFSSTLEMDQLLPIIASKIRDMLECECVNVWMLKGDESIELMHQSGTDLTSNQGEVQRPGEGIPGDVSDSGEAVTISDSSDPRLTARNNGHSSGVHSLIVAPLLDQGALVGVIEATNKNDGTPFDDDDLFVLTSLNETAASALHNASLLMAERKVQVLETLVHVSSEITSTLNLDRVLQSVVNTPSAVIPYERAWVALDQRGKLQLKAISGMEQVSIGSKEVEDLQSILPAIAQFSEPAFVTQRDEVIDLPNHAFDEAFRRYFHESGIRSIYALPLADDEGRLGILSFESTQPDFLTDAHLEVIQVLCGQATVAVRNASLYKEVPFIGFLEPILQKKQRLLALEKRRRSIFMAALGGLALFLAIFPIPMRVDGPAVIAAARSVKIQPEIEGVVRDVYIREGQHVNEGQLLAELEDWNYQSDLAAARAKLQTATLEMNHALAVNDGSLAGRHRVEVEYWTAEVQRCEQRLDRTRLRALFSGWITTPRVEESRGRHLAAGDTFAELVDSTRATADVAMDESEMPLIQQGAKAAVKLDSFPTTTFRGVVEVLSPKSRVDGDTRYFDARVNLSNPDGRLRPGMQGIGKITIGWRPIGYVLFRRPALWVYSKLWSGFGW
jgi:RND family efflux transporter MFP subunit